MNIFFLVIFFLIFNFLITFNFNKIKILHYILDIPDKKRKFHLKSTPLAGGIILIFNLLLYSIFINFFGFNEYNQFIFSNLFEFNIFIITSVLIFILGFIDDKFNLKPLLKFIWLILIFCILIIYNNKIIISSINLSFYKNIELYYSLSFCFTIFCFLVFMNAFNMFDGINLQAGTYSLVIFVHFLFFIPKDFFLILMIIYLFFFLYLNYKNYSFLGDSGSLLIAFIIGYIFIKLFNSEIITFSDTALISMIIPGLDMIRLFFERIIKKRSPFDFDRQHLHHLLIKKFSLSITISVILLLIIIPIIMNYIGLNTLTILLLASLAYISLLIILKNN